MKQLISNYVFDASAGTITLPDFETIDLERLLLITNVTDGNVLFNFAEPTLGATVADNVITLALDTSAMSDTDKLAVRYDSTYGDPYYGKPDVVGNARSKFRDGFSSQDVSGTPKPEIWDFVNETAGGANHIVNYGGNAQGSSYLRISLDPFVDSSEVTLTSKETFQMPMRVGFGVSISQRIIGQECFVGLVGADAAGTGVDTLTPDTDKAITGATATIASNVATFTLTNHGFAGGDRVSIYGCAEHRLNVGPVTVTVIDKNTFTVPCTLTNATYSTVGGYVRHCDPLRYAKNGLGLVFENGTATNATFVSRRNGEKYRSANNTVATTTASQTNTSAHSDSFNAAGTQELFLAMDECSYRSFTSDSNGGISGSNKYSQGIPDEDNRYKLQIRARNLTGMTKPVAKITAIAKTASTTATVTTDVAHGLVTGDYVQVYGVADQTNFPALTGQTVVASAPTSTTFTVVIGTSSTTSSSGGVVFKNEGSVTAPGAFSQAVQSISRASNVLTAVGSGTWTTPLPGEFLQLHGMTGSAAAYDGAYKVLRVNGSSLELESTGADFGSITTGGAVFRRTDIRIHFTRVMDYTRHVVEVNGGRGTPADANNAVPVTIAASATVPASQSTGSTSNTWSAVGYSGFTATAIASAAITTTATTNDTNTPGAVSGSGNLANYGVYSNTFAIPVTAVSGTNPTLDVGIEESSDGGTNWIRVYDFPRITATGNYVSPRLRMTWGSRLRYVQTVSGTTPSFTRSIVRSQFTDSGTNLRQFFDRSIVLTTLNSVTPTYNVDSCDNLMLAINLGAATTPPVLTLEGSEDGTNWYQLGGATLTGVASATAVLYVSGVMPKFARARVSTIGATVTAGYVTIKATGR
ncbi:hypothetical protein [Rhodococcus opacus]|uniref:Uncharacterized protein n=1 Tax=Rhodococcus opacus TaxID=37919 RepID=A0A2S8JAV8_RHOOP|nr:hypothetical protein [Rhodococcus opacus]PQP24178.1 hypothetical protein C5613_14960 [Rhodococcus opacus]